MHMGYDSMAVDFLRRVAKNIQAQGPLQNVEASIDPLVSKLSLFATKTTNENKYHLPELKGTCLICEFLESTNPGKDIKCEDCRVPQAIQPNLLVFTQTSFQREPYRTRGRAPSNSQPATRCTACELSTLIDPSGSFSCPSCPPTATRSSPIAPSSEFKVRRSRAGRNSKLPPTALTRLQAWLGAHQDNPYPSADEKRQLARDCGISEKQINTWFTNARARQLSPLETWLSSGSEDDGAHESDIASAADTPSYTNGFSFLSEAHAMGGRKRAGSVSGSSALSTANTRPQASRRGKKKNYRRANQPPQITENSPITSPISPVQGNNAQADQEMWQCTFCTRQLVPKSWRRHEETQHRPKSEWTCMLDGPRLIRTNTHSECAFCMDKNPCEDHFSRHHRISECAKRPVSERTFYRPDHLRQHVKNFHGAALYEVVQNRWKRKAADVGDKGFTCGFCGVWLENWDRRETHIAGHFKEGATMAEWKDPAVWVAQNKRKQDLDFALEKEKKPKEKEDKHASGLARLSRTLTRLSTRKFDAQEQPQPQRPPTFANTFMPIPVSMPSSAPFSYPMNLAYSAPPQLPDINIDPLIGCDDGFGGLVDWSQMHTSNGDMDMGLGMSMAPETQFGNTTYDPEFDRMMAMTTFGNPGDQHGLGNGNVNVNGWGPN